MTVRIDMPDIRVYSLLNTSLPACQPDREIKRTIDHSKTATLHQLYAFTSNIKTGVGTLQRLQYLQPSTNSKTAHNMNMNMSMSMSMNINASINITIRAGANRKMRMSMSTSTITRINQHQHQHQYKYEYQCLYQNSCRLSFHHSMNAGYSLNV